MYSSIVEIEPKKARSPPGVGDAIALSFVELYPPKLMANITKHEQILKFWQVPKSKHFPTIHHAGMNYLLVPEDVLNKIAEQKDGMLWIAIGSAMIAAVAITAYIFSPRPTAFVEKPVYVEREKPVIVEREKIVPTNCLIFCGGKQ